MDARTLPKQTICERLEEIGALADRLKARANSPLLKDQPEQQNDMRQAAHILHKLARGDKVVEQPFASMPVV